MSNVVVPAACDPLFANKGVAERVSVVIDLLSQLVGNPAGGGGSNVRRVATSAASDNATGVNAVPSVITGWTIGNKAAYWIYLKLYNKATAPVVGDTPVYTIPVPPGGGMVRSDLMIPFPLGWGFRIVKGSADADATAVVADDVTLGIEYAT